MVAFLVYFGIVFGIIISVILVAPIPAQASHLRRDFGFPQSGIKSRDMCITVLRKRKRWGYT